MKENIKLFAVYLGGRADGCNTELHDVVFTCGNKIEDTYLDLLDKWFGNADRLHIDSWVEINHVDGYRVSLSSKKNISKRKLFFINLGGYDKNKLMRICYEYAFPHPKTIDLEKQLSSIEKSRNKFKTFYENLFKDYEIVETFNTKSKNTLLNYFTLV